MTDYFPAKIRILLVFGIFLSLIGLFSSQVSSKEIQKEIKDTYENAFETFLQGHLKDSQSAYHYVDTLGVENAVPVINLALLARDMNQPEEALPLWIKASLLTPNDAFVWNQRAWSYLSLGRFDDARQSFHKAIDVSSNTLWSTEAQFGLGISEVLHDEPKAALTDFRVAFSGNPYVFPAVAAQLANLALRMRQWSTAEIYLKQSISQDPMQPDILEKLAQAYERDHSPKSAWTTYKAVLDVYPENKEALEGMHRTEKYIEMRPEQLLPLRRLAAPVLRKPVEIPPSPRLRVGIFAKQSGELSYVKRLYFIAGADFRIVDSKLGDVTQGKPDEQWELVMPPESLVVEIRDVHHQLQYTTKQPFRIELSTPGATVLLKSAEMADIGGVDIGDRELRGVVEVLPSPYGFQFVNELGVEEYLFSIVSDAMPRNTPMEALQAQAIVSRTKLDFFKQHMGAQLGRVDLCDSSHCQVYAGLGEEREDATQAVLATFGGKLYRESEIYPVQQHLFCGWSTDEGIIDRTTGAASVRSVLDLDRLTHGVADPERYDELWPVPTPSWSRWVRVFDADDLRHNIEKIRYIGKLTNLQVLRRSKSGRVLALRVNGTRDSVTLDGDRAVSDFFSPGGLRSTLFTLQPLYKSHKLRAVVMWGAGTGDGHGLCTAGTLGMAYAGKDYPAILKHYFPGSEIRGMSPKITLLPKEAVRPGGSKEPVAELLKMKDRSVDPKVERARRARLLRERNKRRALEAERKAKQEKAAVAPSTAPVVSPEPAQQSPSTQEPSAVPETSSEENKSE